MILESPLVEHLPLDKKALLNTAYVSGKKKVYMRKLSSPDLVSLHGVVGSQFGNEDSNDINEEDDINLEGKRNMNTMSK